MNYKVIFYIFIIFALFEKSVFSEEININSSNIKVLEKGNIINALNVKANIPSKKIEIEGDKSIYDKKNSQLTIINNVKFFDNLKNIYLEGEKVIYNQLTDLVQTFGKTFIRIEDKYYVYSNDLFYDRKLQKIYTDKETIIKDKKQNVFNLEDNFVFDINNEIITSDKTNIIDNNNNEYGFEKAKIDLKNNAIAGKELKVNFMDSYFGNPDNDPILKGRGATSNENKTKIYKAVFTTCNTENKKCPGWEIQSEEFTHDKINKVFEYKNSWLKIFDKKVLYFPFFSHPDPSVERKSGFLTPVYGGSDNFGSWINIPYFKVINEEKDLTFNPRIYADDKIILQSEYRQAFENSNLISDFSFNNDGKNTNTHLFAKIDGNLNSKTKFDFKYQDVTNDNYLKIHNLSDSSPIIENESLLTTQFKITKNIDDNTNLDTSFTVYEDLSKRDSDRFQYILPNFTYAKNITIPNSYNGNYKFISSGFQKNYDTNKYESLLINDFLFESNNIISESGLLNNYDLLIKNFNSYTENSSSYTEKEDYEVFGSILLKTSFPLKKVNEYSQNYLKPIMAIRYSPNNTKNISDKDVRLNYNNIFSLNRIGTNEIVEGGKSVSLGLEYEKRNLLDKKIIGFNIANSISGKKNNNLPTKSKLNETRSDFVGSLSYNPNDILNFDYNFSYDNNLDGSNYDSVSASINVNNFVTNFNFISEDGEIGNNEIITNTTTYKLNNENNLKFKTSKDLKNNFTEYYNLIYSYETDCLIASAEFNKKFYRDGSLVPDKSLLFTIRFIPFAELKPAATSLN
jgi:LPS-assembly protein